jgi:DNA-binding NtrC family response regulator
MPESLSGPTVLLVDDYAAYRTALGKALEGRGYRVLYAADLGRAAEVLATAAVDVVLLDLFFPGDAGPAGPAGLSFLREHQPRWETTPVIVLTARPESEITIEAMKLGPYEYVPKGGDGHRDRVLRLVEQALERRARSGQARAAGPESPPAGADELVGQSPAMVEVFKRIGEFARKDLTVLILGESGTGKELVARALHRHSRRAGKPFVAVNSAAIAETLLESELFGHEKGAFTGATEAKAGKFEAASGGTLFLDEVGDLSAGGQAKLLRVLQEQHFERVGGNEAVRTDVRVLAATNQDLPALVAQGRFRKELYHRFVVSIPLPPLRDRREDIPLLADYHVRKLGQKAGRPDLRLSEEAKQYLTGRPWPGNVRELVNTLERAVGHAWGKLRVGRQILAEDLQWACGPAPPVRPLREAVAECEERCIRQALEYTGGNVSQAARVLGIDRETVANKKDRYGL